MKDIKESGVDPEFSERLEQLEEGCVFLTVVRGEGLEDLFLPLWRGRNNVNLMVNKKDTHELLYRVFGIETSSKDQGKEAVYQKKLEAVKKARESTTEVEEFSKSETENATPEAN